MQLEKMVSIKIHLEIRVLWLKFPRSNLFLLYIATILWNVLTRDSFPGSFQINFSLPISMHSINRFQPENT